VARVNILQRVKSAEGWGNIALKRDTRGRIKWPSTGRYLIEWREAGKRLRRAAGETPADAFEAQKRFEPLSPILFASAMALQKPAASKSSSSLLLRGRLNGRAMNCVIQTLVGQH